jgi:hypothetical protein
MTDFIEADNCADTSSTYTSSAFTLLGSPPTGFNALAAIVGANRCFYKAYDTSGNWEVQYGLISSVAGTFPDNTGSLSRSSTPISSNNLSGSAGSPTYGAATFSGTVTIKLVEPAGQVAYQSGNNLGGMAGSNGTYGPAVTGYAENQNSTGTLSAGYIYFCPVVIGQAFSSITLNSYISTAGGSSSTLIGLYSNFQGAPLNLLGTSAAFGGSTGWNSKGITLSPAGLYPPGTYWIAVLVENGASSPTFEVIATSMMADPLVVGGDPTSGAPANYIRNATYGGTLSSLPSSVTQASLTWGNTGTGGQGPYVSATPSF